MRNLEDTFYRHFGRKVWVRALKYRQYFSSTLCRKVWVRALEDTFYQDFGRKVWVRALEYFIKKIA